MNTLLKPAAIKFVFVFSFINFIYWLLILHVIDVYQFAVVGAIYELVAIPMLGVTFLMPILAVLQIVMGKSNWATDYLPFYSFLLNVLAVISILMS
ncbi:MAG TPA: hypothetical protein PKC24_16010 [Cyclobacteriaceae bacterium]|nr:hypothetical protein [Cyclobacteriaceae bacterium]